VAEATDPAAPRADLVHVLRSLELTAAAATLAYQEAHAAAELAGDGGAHREQDVLSAMSDQVKRFDPTDAEPLTVFHSRDIPPITLNDVRCDLARRAALCDANTVLVAVALMLRFSGNTRLPLTSHMLHRLFLAALVIAAKAHHDAVPPNRTIARVVGIPVRELCRLELAFARGLDWACIVTLQELDTAIDNVAHASAAHQRRRHNTTTNGGIIVGLDASQNNNSTSDSHIARTSFASASTMSVPS
jgi:hypothetical protein